MQHLHSFGEKMNEILLSRQKENELCAAIEEKTKMRRKRKLLLLMVVPFC
jgi:hypothetical protein